MSEMFKQLHYNNSQPDEQTDTSTFSIKPYMVTYACLSAGLYAG